jgi:hypothetical protein
MGTAMRSALLAAAVLLAALAALPAAEAADVAMTKEVCLGGPGLCRPLACVAVSETFGGFATACGGYGLCQGAGGGRPGLWAYVTVCAGSVA